MLTKTQYAFMFSCEELFRRWENIYFWTMTFRSVPYSDDAAMEDWGIFRKRLCWWYPRLEGLRVIELHKSHGIHFHFFINRRIGLDHMAKIAFGSGKLIGHNRYTDFGRMSVVKCDKDPRSIYYLMKYLTKQYRVDNWFGRRRRWGAMGGFENSRVSDIIVESDATRNRKQIFGEAQCSYTALMMLTHFTNLWGPVEGWPAGDRALVLAQQLKHGGHWLKHRNTSEKRLLYQRVPDGTFVKSYDNPTGETITGDELQARARGANQAEALSLGTGSLDVMLPVRWSESVIQWAHGEDTPFEL